MISKICTICKIEKPEFEFTFQSRKGRYAPYCRKCNGARKRELDLLRKTHPEPKWSTLSKLSKNPLG